MTGNGSIDSSIYSSIYTHYVRATGYQAALLHTRQCLLFVFSSVAYASLDASRMSMLCCCLPAWVVQANAGQLQLVLNDAPGSCLQLESSAAYQMPLDDAVGPLHLTPVSDNTSGLQHQPL
jgi:hypothetical protein